MRELDWVNIQPVANERFITIIDLEDIKSII